MWRSCTTPSRTSTSCIYTRAVCSPSSLPTAVSEVEGVTPQGLIPPPLPSRLEPVLAEKDQTHGQVLECSKGFTSLVGMSASLVRESYSRTQPSPHWLGRTSTSPDGYLLAHRPVLPTSTGPSSLFKRTSGFFCSGWASCNSCPAWTAEACPLPSCACTAHLPGVSPR